MRIEINENYHLSVRPMRGSIYSVQKSKAKVSSRCVVLMPEPPSNHQLFSLIAASLPDKKTPSVALREPCPSKLCRPGAGKEKERERKQACAA